MESNKWKIITHLLTRGGCISKFTQHNKPTSHVNEQTEFFDMQSCWRNNKSTIIKAVQ